MLLYAVTDRAFSKNNNLIFQVEAALKGGATCVQLREKNLDFESFLSEAKEISALCKKFDVPFIINDNVEIALKSNASGIHIGQKDMPASKVRQIVGKNMIMGVSVHNLKEAKKAEEDGADYLGVGAMFKTSTKDDAEIVSKNTLKAICSATSLPVVAIGGINKENIKELSKTGACGVALVSAIFSAEDIEARCKDLKKLSEETFLK